MDILVPIAAIAFLWIWLGITPLLNGRPTILPLRKLRMIYSIGLGFTVLWIAVILPLYWSGPSATTVVLVLVNLGGLAVVATGILRLIRYRVGESWQHYFDGFVVLGVRQERFRQAFTLALVSRDAAVHDDALGAEYVDRASCLSNIAIGALLLGVAYFG